MQPPHSSEHSRCRVLVTRPRREAASLVEALAARGAEAVVEPLLDLHYHNGPAPNLAGVQAILCTSANGAHALARLSRERALPLLAVGDATARRARDEGFVHVESAGGALPDLVRLAAERLNPRAGSLLHVAGSAIAGDLAGELSALGFTVNRAVLYEARPVDALSPAIADAIAAGAIDAATFFSPRTAGVFARLVERAGLGEAMHHIAAVSISDAADRALSGLRFDRRLIAARPDQMSLLAVLDRVLDEWRCPA